MAEPLRNHRFVLLAIILSVVLIPINSTMIAVGLAPIARGLGVAVPAVVWAVTAYLVVMAALQPIAGKMGDLYGRRRLLLWGLVIFLLCSVMAAVIPHLWAFIAFRSGQALGGALMVPNAMGVLRRLFRADDLRRVLGIVGLVQGLGAAVGPLLGVALISIGGWPAMLWVNVPIVGFALIVASRQIAPDGPMPRRSVDFGGAFGLATFLAFVALSVPRTHASKTWLTTVPLALASLGLFLRMEKRARDPVVRFELFKRPPFLSANLAILASNFFMYSTLLYMPLYLKNRSFGTSVTGELLFLFSFAMSMMSFGGSWLSRWIGSRRVVGLAFLLDLVVVLWYVGLGAHSGMDYIVAGLVVAGFGAGVGTVSMQATALEAVSVELAGVSSGIYSTFRYIGSITASALVSLMALSQGVHWAILTMAALLGLAIVRGFPARVKQDTEPSKQTMATH